MNAKQIEVHDYYKTMYPEALIIYRMPGAFMVLGNDVARAQKSIPNINVLDTGVGSMPDDISVISQLAEDGTEVHLIQYRDDSGAFSLPDIARIEAEKAMDY